MLRQFDSGVSVNSVKIDTQMSQCNRALEC